MRLEVSPAPVDRRSLRFGSAASTAQPAVLGVPALDALLADDRVTEIMVNGPADVWVERDGKLSPTDVRLADATEVMALIERIVAPLGRRCDARTPMVDARLADGSRVHA